MKHSNYLFKAIALALFMTAPLAMMADELCLVVNETSGSQTYFALSEEPVATFEGTTMTVATSAMEITLSIAEVDSYTFEQGMSTMIGKAVATEDGNTVFSNGMAYVTGLQPGASVRVYTIDGQQVSSTTASSTGEACVNLSSLKAGTVYVLRTPSASYKIMNK